MRVLSEPFIQSRPVSVLDPSDKFRPEKSEKQFRDFTSSGEYYDRVRRTYDLMHTHQTVQYVQQRISHWTQYNHAQMTILEALGKLDQVVDESDPDVDVPNSVHAYQTAERIREAHPHNTWLQLTGLIHDVGKVMALWGEPQFSICGDTFPVGCEFSHKIVFGKESFSNNDDYTNSKYNTKLGVYKEGDGLDTVTMSWGHDEYLYRVLRHHPACSLPEEALYIVRYHSFYPWHTAGEYQYLTNQKDQAMLHWVQEFNKFDLYSKSDAHPDVEKLTPYYQELADKFLPGVMEW